MKPKFKTNLAWEQAQLLMQPALIRVLDNIRKQLDASDWKGTYDEVTEPIPGYILTLSKGDRSLEIDIWQLCYQVCFQDYALPQQHLFSNIEQRSIEVDIDERLLSDTGELDWHLIETKAQQTVRSVFSDIIPNPSQPKT